MKIVNQLTFPNVSYVTMQSFEEENLREEGKHTTVANSGCGLCSSVMVAHRLIANCNFELNDAINLSYEIKANAYRGTDYKIYAPAFAEKLNLKLETTNDTERVRYCLKTGGTVVAHVGGDNETHVGIFSHGGHYVVVINEEPDGRVAVVDPSFKPDKYEEEGRKGKVEIKSEVIALCSLNELAKDCSTRNPSFYLFWRN